MKTDKYYMQFAKVAATVSEDPSTKTGAVLVNTNGEIISTGYNRFPDDLDFGWNNKYPYVVHSEVDCIVGVPRSYSDGGTLFVTLFPCNECAKVIQLAGIKRVVYLDDKYITEDYSLQAINIFEKCGISYEKL